MIQALKDRLWDEDTRSFWFYDVSAQKKYHAPIISAYFPLLIDGYDEKLAADLLADLKTHHWAEYPLSTVRTDDEKFTPNCYWRGPSWLVLNWFFHKAFGDEIIDKSIKLIEKGGFREYFNPLTGEGYGAQQFSWSAALLIDMIHKKSC